MNLEKKEQILDYCFKAHALTEQCYRDHPAAKGDPEWLNKRKYLLADLSLHMVQAALQKEKPDVQLLRRYLFSLLTICEDYIPGEGLSDLADRLMQETSTT